ncbi:heavy metal translocating P-type ATPase [Microbacterium sp. MPKO10]|uniref:heavy metal translocating P-type ATPase n=1 Tax=Microbacterium sp. MPKO10 TaxID=2989818 RepID=UPI0022354748|nr:heavy metal translocating P-type ATPase [Microbacterium sp. MPKO10]MCW4459195.1 heavy metal translocating P-type ATPase [Microbacterium sp. MPKO10]
MTHDETERGQRPAMRDHAEHGAHHSAGRGAEYSAEPSAHDHAGHTAHSTSAAYGESGEHAPSAHGSHEGHSSHEGHNSHEGHGAHGGHDHSSHVTQFRRLFWIMLVVSLPTAFFSAMFASILGYARPEFPGVDWISPVLGTIIFVWGGRPFLTGAVSELRSRQPGMMLLIGMAISVAFVASLGSSLGLLDHQLDFWWELALLIVIMLLGHWIEMRSLAQTSSALDSLAALLPDEAERVTGDAVETISPEDLVVDDLVIVRPGGRVPADGTVEEGTAAVDESMVTGESVPVTRGPGDRVVAGTIATDTALRVRVSAIGDDTALAGIRKLVSDAQNSSSRAQRLADRAAALLFWFALSAAVITALVWVLIGQPDAAVIRTITVLVIACPHALGLAIPLVVSIATERAARSGVLVRDRLALESMRTIDTVVFDKTGTLTRGEPAVGEVASIDGTDEAHVLALAAAAESDSEHPLARAIVREAEHRGVMVPRAAEFRSEPALGVTATIDGAVIRVGGPAMLRDADAEPLDTVDPWSDEGAIVLHVLRDGQVIGALKLADDVRDESAIAVEKLHARGIRVVMITGDAQAVADAVANELAIDEVHAGVLPENKASTISGLQKQGRRVAMVGDGVNDAPALAQADVGLAIGAGTDVAIGSAGVILASDDPRSVLSVIELSRATYRKMTQNLWWAGGYNLISVPLAAGVLAPIGFVLPVAVGALLMSASTVVVALNAQLLRRLDLSPESR